MRWFVLRVLGADVLELGIGRDDLEPAAGDLDETPAQLGVASSADLSAAPRPFGFGAASPHDEPLVLDV